MRKVEFPWSAVPERSFYPVTERCGGYAVLSSIGEIADDNPDYCSDHNCKVWGYDEAGIW